jgi:hypothetical protein
MEGVLTNRENASLNSETCSSVRESACRSLSAWGGHGEGGWRRVFHGGVGKHEAGAGSTHHVCWWACGLQGTVGRCGVV